MPITGLAYTPSRVTLHLTAVSVSTDGVTYYEVGQSKTVKLTAKAKTSVDNESGEKTYGYTLAGKWRMLQLGDDEFDLLTIAATGKLYIRFAEYDASFLNHDIQALLKIEEAAIDGDGGESYLDCSFTKVVSPTIAATFMKGVIY
jgi:hypothetical protein